MRYILIANNPLIMEKEINSLELTNNDVVILFNHNLPLRWEKIKNHPNKILFARILNWGLLSRRAVNINADKFTKIIPCSHTKISDEGIKKFFASTMGAKYLGKLELVNSSLNKVIMEELHYPEKKTPTLGFYAYVYVKYILEPGNQIYLMGFTQIYNGKFGSTSGHGWEFEREFYKKDLLEYPLLTKNDAVPLNVPLNTKNSHRKNIAPARITQPKPPQDSKQKPLKINMSRAIPLKSPIKKPVAPPKKPENTSNNNLRNLLKMHISRTKKIKR